MSGFSAITCAAVLALLSLCACSKAEFKEFAENTRIRAENFGATVAAKEAAYPIESEGGEGVVVPAKAVERTADDGEQQLADPKPTEGISPPTIIFYESK